MSMVLPIAIEWKEWVATLFVDFSPQDIPFPPDEKEWQTWAERMVERNVFQNDNIPSPIGFADWRAWAQRVVSVLNV